LFSSKLFNTPLPDLISTVAFTMASIQVSTQSFNPKAAQHEIARYFQKEINEGKTVTVDYLGNGSYNVVYEVNMTGWKHPIVFRLPLERDHKSPDEIILRELKKHSSKWKALRIPLAASLVRNQFPWPFTVMDRIPGDTLNKYWPHISHNERMSLATQFGTIYRDFLNTRSPIAGRISVVSHRGPSKLFLDPLGSEGTTKPTGMRNMIDIFAKDKSKFHLLSHYHDLIRRTDKISTSYECISVALDWQILMTDLNLNQEYDRDTYVRCKVIVDRMNWGGVFSKMNQDRAPFTLWHKDLFPRNIMVARDKSNNVEISGIIDWDSAIYAPSFAAAPPHWMWSRCYFNKVPCCGDDFEVEKFWYEECSRPQDHNSKLIREAFYKSAGQEWQRLADDRPSFIARKILDIAMGHPLSYAGGNSTQQKAREFLYRLEMEWDIVDQSHISNKSEPGTSPEPELYQWPPEMPAQMPAQMERQIPPPQMAKPQMAQAMAQAMAQPMAHPTAHPTAHPKPSAFQTVAPAPGPFAIARRPVGQPTNGTANPRVF
jgi:hypothetical protein